MSECTHAEMAHGTAARGPMCTVDSTAPSVEFCKGNARLGHLCVQSTC